ncbi:MAG: hypothetical protein ABIF71_08135 [Planctomycetota bacterium]
MPEEPIDPVPPDQPVAAGTMARWGRIVIVIGLALTLFYICISFRLIVIPDDYVALHPRVLPGQHWVYRVIHDGIVRVKPGSRLIFAFDTPGGKPAYHISIVVGHGGQTVVYEPATRKFLVDGVALALEVELAAVWSEGGRERFDVPAGSLLLIDSCAAAGGRRFWEVKAGRVRGQLLFQLPF